MMSNQLFVTVEVNHFTHDHWRIGLWLQNLDTTHYDVCRVPQC